MSPDIKDTETKSWKDIEPPSNGSQITETNSLLTTWDWRTTGTNYTKPKESLPEDSGNYKDTMPKKF